MLQKAETKYLSRDLNRLHTTLKEINVALHQIQNSKSLISSDLSIQLIKYKKN